MSQPHQDETIWLEFYMGNPKAAPFSDWEDFQSRGTLYGRREFTFHPFHGREILIPVATPDYPRATMEELQAAIDDLPDRGYGAGTFCVVDHHHPLGPWFTQNQEQAPLGSCRGYAAPRTFLYSYVLMLFRPTRDNLFEAILQGWFQGWWDYIGVESFYELFRKASEKYGTIRAGATTFTEEELRSDWSSLAYALFSRRHGVQSDAAVFETCLAYPVRCAIVASAMQCFVGIRASERGRPIMHHYCDRASFIGYTAASFALKRFSENPSSVPVDAKGELIALLKSHTDVTRGATASGNEGVHG